MSYRHFTLSLIAGVISLDYIVSHAPFSVFTGTTEVISQHAKLQLCDCNTETGCYGVSIYDVYFCLKHCGDV